MAIKPSWSERVRAVITTAIPEVGGVPKPGAGGITSATSDGVTLTAGPPGDHVLLLAQTTPGLNGPWIYNGASTAMTRPDDFGGVTNPTAAFTVTAGPEGTTRGNSRWRTTWSDGFTLNTTDPKFAPEDLVLNIRLFGAVGDGATDDQTAIQAAINAASAAGGGTVFFPKGTYLVRGDATTGIALQLKSNVVLRGTGSGSVIQVKSGTGDNASLMMQGTLAIGAGVEKLYLDGNTRNLVMSSAYGHGAIRLTGCTNCIIQEVEMFDFGLTTSTPAGAFILVEAWEANDNYPSNLLGGTATPSRNNRVAKCIFHDAGSDDKSAPKCQFGIRFFTSFSFNAAMPFTSSQVSTSPNNTFEILYFVGSAAYDPTSYSNGTPVAFVGGSLPSPLSTSTQYYVVNYTAATSKFQVSTTSGGSAVSLSTTGSGTMMVGFLASVSTSTGVITTVATHNLLVGNPVLVQSSVALPAGLDTETQYYVLTVTATTLTLGKTPGGPTIVPTTTGSGTITVALGWSQENKGNEVSGSTFYGFDFIDIALEGPLTNHNSIYANTIIAPRGQVGITLDKGASYNAIFGNTIEGYLNIAPPPNGTAYMWTPLRAQRGFAGMHTIGNIFKVNTVNGLGPNIADYSACCYVAGAERTIVQGNTFNGLTPSTAYSYGVRLDNQGSPVALAAAVIANNTIFNVGYGCASHDSASLAPFDDVAITGNDIEASVYGLLLTGTSPAGYRRAKVLGNAVRIVGTGLTTGVYLGVGCTDSLAAGNHVNGAYYGIVTQDIRNVIDGNHVVKFAYIGYYVLGAGSTGSRISNNTARRDLTAAPVASLQDDTSAAFMFGNDFDQLASSDAIGIQTVAATVRVRVAGQQVMTLDSAVHIGPDGTSSGTWLRINGATGATSPGAGGAGALPATPAGYLTVNINGTSRQIPYY